MNILHDIERRTMEKLALPNMDAIRRMIGSARLTDINVGPVRGMQIDPGSVYTGQIPQTVPGADSNTLRNALIALGVGGGIGTGAYGMSGGQQEPSPEEMAMLDKQGSINKLAYGPRPGVPEMVANLIRANRPMMVRPSHAMLGAAPGADSNTLRNALIALGVGGGIGAGAYGMSGGQQGPSPEEMAMLEGQM